MSDDDPQAKAERRAVEAVHHDQRVATHMVQVERARQYWDNARQEAQLDSISNALDAARIQSQNTQRAYDNAVATGNQWVAEEAARQLGELHQNINELQAGLNEYETMRAEQAAPPRQQQPITQFSDVNTALAALPHLTNGERQWIREHPESVTRQGNLERLRIAYLDAQDRGLKRGSAEYFDFMSDRLGFARQREPGTEEIALSKEQREIARISGISDSDYARNVQRLKAMRRDGFFQS